MDGWMDGSLLRIMISNQNHKFFQIKINFVMRFVMYLTL